MLQKSKHTYETYTTLKKLCCDDKYQAHVLMASSSDEALDESIPEMVYKTPSLIDETTYRKEDSFLKCPLCNNSSRCFYCVDCVRSGNFTHSQKKCFDRFADKKPRKYNLDEEKIELNKKFEEKLAKRKEEENLKFSIILRKEKINLLKQGIKAGEKEIEKNVKRMEILKEKSQKLKVRLNEQNQKLTNLEELNAQADSKNGEVATKLKSVQSAFEIASQQWICELRNSIFPIVKTPPRYHRSETSTEEGQCAELDEAQKTTYIQGQWVFTSSPVDDYQYAIVDALVPSTGDYSSYTNWCAKNEPLAIYRGDWAPLQRHQCDIAYGISAGLAYAAQLSNVISYYLDVHLPKKSSFNDFCQYENASKFNHQVAKLNANIIHLCLHRQVDVARLSAHRLMSNLLLVFDPQANDSLHAISLQEKEDLLGSLENSICKDLLGEESDDDIEADFEYITTDEVPKADSPPVSEQVKEETESTRDNPTGLEQEICEDGSKSEDNSNAYHLSTNASTIFSSVVTSIYRAAIGRR